MLEAEWLTSKDPGAMLAYLESGYQQLVTYARSPQVFSDRKLRRWVEACREASGEDYSSPRDDLDDPVRFARAVDAWSRMLLYHGEFPAALRCHFLREVFGNPFRPVHFVPGHYYYDALTPAALDLARCAYGEMCPECSGSGAVENDTGGNVGTKHCRTCHGTGHAAPDWDILPVLADMLEENGCDCDDLLRHLRGQEWCWRCGGEAPARYTCDVCNPQRLDYDFYSGWVPLRGPHCRGCWALSLILGED